MALPTVNPIGPYQNYCSGYGEPGWQGLGYVSTMKLAAGLVEVSDYQGDFVLENIVSYDKAEKANAYIGQSRIFICEYPTILTKNSWRFYGAWPQRCEEEAARLTPIFGVARIEIHHVGSTSVAELSAKPEIDILAIVNDQNIPEACTGALRRLGYGRSENSSILISGFAVGIANMLH